MVRHLKKLNKNVFVLFNPTLHIPKLLKFVHMPSTSVYLGNYTNHCSKMLNFIIFERRRTICEVGEKLARFSECFCMAKENARFSQDFKILRYRILKKSGKIPARHNYNLQSWSEIANVGKMGRSDDEGSSASRHKHRRRYREDSDEDRRKEERKNKHSRDKKNVDSDDDSYRRHSSSSSRKKRSGSGRRRSRSRSRSNESSRKKSLRDKERSRTSGGNRYYHSKRKSRSRSRSRERNRGRKKDIRRSGKTSKRSRRVSSPSSSSSRSPSSSSRSRSKSKSRSRTKSKSRSPPRTKPAATASTSSSASLIARIEEKLDLGSQVHRLNVIDDIENESFVQQPFRTTQKPLTLEDIPLPSLELKPVDLSGIEKEVLCHPDLILNQRQREEQWIKRLYAMRQKLRAEGKL